MYIQDESSPSSSSIHHDGSIWLIPAPCRCTFTLANERNYTNGGYPGSNPGSRREFLVCRLDTCCPGLFVGIFPSTGTSDLLLPDPGTNLPPSSPIPSCSRTPPPHTPSSGPHAPVGLGRRTAAEVGVRGVGVLKHDSGVPRGSFGITELQGRSAAGEGAVRYCGSFRVLVGFEEGIGR